jgi:uncharacterized protein (DUF2235 family)
MSNNVEQAINKRLIFFFDGSGDSVAADKQREFTNVFKLVRAINYDAGDKANIAFYFAGVGTRENRLSAITGAGLDFIIRESYVTLAANYYPGDEIYIFGFSRGAAAARALTGMISKVGLLAADEVEEFPKVWRRFLDEKGGKLDNGIWAGDNEPKVQFLGVFDTVVGRSWDRFNLFGKVRFRSLALDPCVQVGVQLLSIDDNRIPSFRPLLWTRTSTDKQALEQIWMPGVHADVGGSSGAVVLNNASLLKMIERVRNYCPQLDWDDDFINGRQRAIDQNKNNVEISDERFDWSRKLLRRGARTITASGDSCEFSHPILDQIAGQEIKFKGKRKIYVPKNVPADLPRI